AFVGRAGFADGEALIDPILWMLSALQAYTEEGRHLYPEVVITTSVTDLMKPLAYHSLAKIGDAPIDIAFQRALKVCAPLAVGNWAIWIEVRQSEASFGVVDGSASELAPTLQTQLVGE